MPMVLGQLQIHVATPTGGNDWYRDYYERDGRLLYSCPWCHHEIQLGAAREHSIMHQHHGWGVRVTLTQPPASWDATIQALAQLHALHGRRKTDKTLAAARDVVQKAEQEKQARIRREAKYLECYQQYQITPSEELKEQMLSYVDPAIHLVNDDIADMARKATAKPKENVAKPAKRKPAARDFAPLGFMIAVLAAYSQHFIAYGVVLFLTLLLAIFGKRHR